MRVRVVGHGLLAQTTRQCCVAAGFDVISVGPDVIWICVDTPVVDDVPDVEAVMAETAEWLTPGALVLISSQVPVGTCAELERRHPEHTFAVSPENIRRGSPLEDFMGQDRIIIGAREYDGRLDKLFAPFCRRVLWMTPESAEMVKHALNGYLAMCIAFANDIADICTTVGANVEDVFDGFRSDPRVSRKAPLKPGGPYTGGTLGRDIHVLSGLGTGPLIPAVAESNRRRL